MVEGQLSARRATEVVKEYRFETGNESPILVHVLLQRESG